jgi:kynurenine formamidase
MRIIDLTLSYKNGMRGVDIQPARVLEKDGWNATTLKLYSHAGTHMDAPFHFGVGDNTIDELPLECCMGNAWIVNIRNCQERQLVTVRDLREMENKFIKGDSLIIKTGWSQFLNESKYREALPRISQDLARWCVEKQVKILAVEPPSVADVFNMEEVTSIHKILLGGGVAIVEGITNTESLQTDKVLLYAIPLKIWKGDGAPARVFAIID